MAFYVKNVRIVKTGTGYNYVCDTAMDTIWGKQYEHTDRLFSKDFATKQELRLEFFRQWFIGFWRSNYFNRTELNWRIKACPEVLKLQRRVEELKAERDKRPALSAEWEKALDAWTQERNRLTEKAFFLYTD